MSEESNGGQEPEENPAASLRGQPPAVGQRPQIAHHSPLLRYQTAPERYSHIFVFFFVLTPRSRGSNVIEAQAQAQASGLSRGKNPIRSNDYKLAELPEPAVSVSGICVRFCGLTANSGQLAANDLLPGRRSALREKCVCDASQTPRDWTEMTGYSSHSQLKRANQLWNDLPMLIRVGNL